jgi:hypothetical protein
MLRLRLAVEEHRAPMGDFDKAGAPRGPYGLSSADC